MYPKIYIVNKYVKIIMYDYFFEIQNLIIFNFKYLLHIRQMLKLNLKNQIFVIILYHLNI